MPRVIHFDLPAKDPERARSFYNQVFDWQINDWEGSEEYLMVKTGECEARGIDGGIYKETDKVKGVTTTIEVEELDEYITRVELSGGKVLTGIREIPGIGRMVYAKDTEGTEFGMLEPTRRFQKRRTVQSVFSPVTQYLRVFF